MSKPTRKDLRRVVRLSKYLKDSRNQRIKQESKFEALDNTLTVHADLDWAGCTSSRKSTSARIVSTNVGGVQAPESNAEADGCVVGGLCMPVFCAAMECTHNPHARCHLKSTF